ncbi:MAG: hypothetical protein ACOX2M_06330 [Fastidiosipilaceae bacterium]
MKYFLYVLVGGLLLSVLICAVIKSRLKRRLKSIDGFVGITRNNSRNGRVVGGVIQRPSEKRAFPHQNR